MVPILMDVPAASPQLARELWISFASLLRSHVAMHAIARPSAALQIISHADAEVEIQGPRGTLRVTEPDASGSGGAFFRSHLEDAAPEESTFTFDADGLLHFERPAMDLESAAEDLLRKVQA